MEKRYLLRSNIDCSLFDIGIFLSLSRKLVMLFTRFDGLTSELLEEEDAVELPVMSTNDRFSEVFECA